MYHHFKYNHKVQCFELVLYLYELEEKSILICYISPIRKIQINFQINYQIYILLFILGGMILIQNKNILKSSCLSLFSRYVIILHLRLNKRVFISHFSVIWWLCEIYWQALYPYGIKGRSCSTWSRKSQVNLTVKPCRLVHSKLRGIMFAWINFVYTLVCNWQYSNILYN